MLSLAQCAPLFLSTGALPRHCPGGPSLSISSRAFLRCVALFFLHRGLPADATIATTSRPSPSCRSQRGGSSQSERYVGRPPWGTGVDRKELALKIFVQSLGEIPPSPRSGSAFSTTAASFVCVIHACERGEPMPIYPQKRTTSARLPALQRKCYILALAPAKGCETRGPSELTEPVDGC